MRLLDPVECLNGLASTVFSSVDYIYEGFVDNHDLVLSRHCMESVTTYGVRKSRKEASAKDKENKSYCCHFATITGTDIAIYWS